MINLGTDIVSDWSFSDGDLNIVTGTANLAQAIQNRFDNLNWAENQLNKSDSPIPGNMTNLNDSIIDSSLSEIYVKDTSIYNNLEGGYLPDSSFDGNLEGGYLLDSSFDGNLEGGYLPDSSFKCSLCIQ